MINWKHIPASRLASFEYCRCNECVLRDEIKSETLMKGERISKNYRVTGSVRVNVGIVIEAKNESDAVKQAIDIIESAVGDSAFDVDLAAEQTDDEATTGV